MKRWVAPLLCAAGAALAAAVFLLRPPAGPEPLRLPDDLRDAPRAQMRDLGRAHAALGLAGPGADGCVICHLPAGAARRTALWGRPEGWIASAGPAAAREEAPRASDSAICLSCHDGVSAVEVAGHVGAGRRGAAISRADSHPIGMDYLAAWSARPGELHDPMGNPGIVLDGTKVGCVSCHVPHGEPRFSADRPVCLSCHNR